MSLLRLITFRQQAEVGVDADAQAFITAAGITDSTQQSAINTLVLDLKGYGIWTKMKAVYPFVGGTATTHKYNLKDPRDLDAAFRLNFVGTWTHASTGAINSSGSAGTSPNYADTFLVPSSELSSITNLHMSLYSRTGGNLIGYSMGAGGFTNFAINMYTMINNLAYVSVNGDAVASTTSDGLGLFTITSTSTNRKIYKNTASSSASAASGNLINFSIYIGGSNLNNTVQYPTNREYAFGSIGDGLSDAEVSNLYTAVQAFQTTLGRQV